MAKTILSTGASLPPCLFIIYLFIYLLIYLFTYLFIYSFILFLLIDVICFDFF